MTKRIKEEHPIESKMEKEKPVKVNAKLIKKVNYN